jgi:Rps23 Pro-64 3,4-dihydroxylase Tpa1-like proline 4-hydroxylase
MVEIGLLLQGGHNLKVELDEEDPVLAELVACLARSPHPTVTAPSKLFNLNCTRRNRSLLFAESALVALTLSQPIGLERDVAMNAEIAIPNITRKRQTPAVIIDDFLSSEDNARIHTFIVANSHRFSAARSGGDGTEQRMRNLMEDISRLRDWMMMQVLPLLPAICSQLALSYASVETFECQITSYCDGDYSRPHADIHDGTVQTSVPPPQRLLSYSYYLHSTPKQFDGGTLQFYESAGIEPSSCTIKPQNNRIVFFPSHAVHEVTPVSLKEGGFESSRLSVNGWIGCRK